MKKTQTARLAPNLVRLRRASGPFQQTACPTPAALTTLGQHCLAGPHKTRPFKDTTDMKGLLLVTAFLAAVFAPCSGQNTPSGLRCNPVELMEWINGPQGTSAHWEDLLTSRDFTGLCNEVDVWFGNLGGCIQGALSLIDTIAGTTLLQEIQAFYNVLAHVQFYCGTAQLNMVCDVNAITGCATATILTFQQSIQGTVDEISTICTSYNTVLDTMNKCFETAVSMCPPDEKLAIENSYDMVFFYFETVSMYCGETCGDFILLATSQFENCDYVSIDYTSLQFQDYCTYIQNTLDCLWTVYSACPIATPEQTRLGMTGILTYGGVLGCNVNVGGVTRVDLDQNDIDMVLPPCPAAAITCTQTVANAIGLATTAGIYGGYNYLDVIVKGNEYFNQLTSGDFGDICILVEDVVWNTVTICSDLIVDNCPTSTGPQAQMIINGDITPYIQGACDENCQAIQEAIEGYLTCTEDILTDTPLDPLLTTIETLTGLISPGGGNVAICSIVQSYLNCILPQIQKCDFLYANYVQLVTMYSTIDYTITVCNIEFKTSTGELTIVSDFSNPLFKFSDAVTPGASMVVVMATAVTALVTLR